jgi:uncharacterized membrane protein HdeD (DUF308 family)
MTAPRLRPTASRHLWWLVLVLAIAAVALALVARPLPASSPDALPVASEPGVVTPLSDVRAI